MKPQGYLTKEGIKIFNEILKHLQKASVEDVDTYKLSTLANAFDLHARASKEMNKSSTAYSQKTSTGYTQITSHVTMWQKTAEIINKLSPAFGIDLASREKITAFAEKKSDIPSI